MLTVNASSLRPVQYEKAESSTFSSGKQLKRVGRPMVRILHSAFLSVSELDLGAKSPGVTTQNVILT